MNYQLELQARIRNKYNSRVKDLLDLLENVYHA